MQISSQSERGASTSSESAGAQPGSEVPGGPVCCSPQRCTVKRVCASLERSPKFGEKAGFKWLGDDPGKQVGQDAGGEHS